VGPDGGMMGVEARNEEGTDESVPVVMETLSGGRMLDIFEVMRSLVPEF
jgi:hypothetical protein